MNRIIILLMSMVFLLVGCGQTQYVTLYDKEYIKIPQELFHTPRIPPPEFTREDYLTSPPDLREELMVEYNIELLKVAKQFLDVIRNLQAYNNKQQETVDRIIKEHNDGKSSR